MGLSIPHVTLVLIVVLIVFGTKNIRSLGSDLGGAIKGFKQAIKEEDNKDKLS